MGGTLKDEGNGAFALDLSQTRGHHKTARFYGPSKTSISLLICPWITKYIEALTTFDKVDDNPVFYIFPVGSDFSRCVTSSAWSSLVKSIFKRYTGKETCPKTLRASYICWLKAQTDCPSILKAAATAMRHKEETQGSDRYDKVSLHGLKLAFPMC